MACTVLLEINAKPEHVEEVKAFFKKNLPETRRYDGCVSVDVHDNMDKPGNIVVYERWDTRPQYEKYLAWRTETGTMDAFGAFLEGPPSIRFFEDVDA